MKTLQRVATLLLAISMLSGCGLTLTAQQKGILEKYASAANTGGAEASSDLQLAYESTMHANRQILVMMGMSNNVALAKIEGPLKGLALTERVNTAKILEDYGELLASLASSNKKGEFRKAATKAMDGINEFDETLIEDDVQEGVTIAVMAVGGLFSERKKTKAIEKVVLAYHKPVNHLCDLLLSDLGLEGDEDGVAYSVESACQDLKRVSRKVLRDANSSVADRVAAMEAEAFAYDTRNRLNDRSKLFFQVLQKLKKNNDDLAQAFKDGIPKEFDLLIDEVKGLADLAKELTD